MRRRGRLITRGSQILPLASVIVCLAAMPLAHTKRIRWSKSHEAEPLQ